jgi:hypothetical protein
MKSDKIMVKETLTLDERILENNLEDVINSLRYYQSQGWEGLRANYCGDYIGHELYKERPETDAEYNSRLKSEKLSKERRRQKYEELKKEFEA